MVVSLISKFKPLFQSDTRYFVLTGGRGSAKSFHVADFLLKLSYEQGHTILFTRYTMISAHLSVIPEFTDKIDRYDLEDCFDVTKAEITNKASDSLIIFKGIKTSSGNQTAALKSLQGITTWVLDEAEELVDENIFDKIDESVRVKGVQNRVIIILNPSTKEHWIYKRFFEESGVKAGFNGIHGNTTYIHTTYLDNKENISESIIDKFEKLKETHPQKYNHRVLGGWLDKAEGVIFENWNYGTFDESLPFIHGLDYGFYPDPTALTKIAIDKRLMKMYVKQLVYDQKLTTDQLALKLPKGNQLIVCDNSEPRLTSELTTKGHNMRPVTKFNDSIKAGIDLMSQYEIIVDPDSTDIGKELNNYVWNDRKSSTPIDDWNHAIDSIRYGVMEYENLKHSTKASSYKMPKERRVGANFMKKMR
jgi:phage terminase large subunit